MVTCSVRLSSLGTACATSTLSYCGAYKAPPLAVYVQRGGVTLDPSASDVTLPPCDDAANRMDCLVYPFSSTSGSCRCSGLSTLLKQGNTSMMQNYSCPWPCNQPFTSGVVLSHMSMQSVSTARVQACMHRICACIARHSATSSMRHLFHTSAYAPAYASVRQHTSATFMRACMRELLHALVCVMHRGEMSLMVRCLSW